MANRRTVVVDAGKVVVAVEVLVAVTVMLTRGVTMVVTVEVRVEVIVAGGKVLVDCVVVSHPLPGPEPETVKHVEVKPPGNEHRVYEGEGFG